MCYTEWFLRRRCAESEWDRGSLPGGCPLKFGEVGEGSCHCCHPTALLGLWILLVRWKIFTDGNIHKCSRRTEANDGVRVRWARMQGTANQAKGRARLILSSGFHAPTCHRLFSVPSFDPELKGKFLNVWKQDCVVPTLSLCQTTPFEGRRSCRSTWLYLTRWTTEAPVNLIDEPLNQCKNANLGKVAIILNYTAHIQGQRILSWGQQYARLLNLSWARILLQYILHGGKENAICCWNERICQFNERETL